MSCFKRFAVVVGAVAVMAGSAFASWDYFPPKESGGEAKLTFEYIIPDKDVSAIHLGLGGRYTIMSGLEAGLWLPIPMSLSVKDYDDAGKGYAGLTAPELMVRYWLTDLGLGFFLDAVLPVETRSKDDGFDKIPFVLALGAQYSMSVTDEFKFGAELGIIVPFARESHFQPSEFKITDGMDLEIGLEGRYSIGAITPYLNLGLAFGLTKYVEKFEGETVYEAEDPQKMGIDLIIGADYDITETMNAGLYLGFFLGERYIPKDSDADMPWLIGLQFTYGF